MRYLALDLARLEFLAAAGLRALINADRRFRSAEAWVVLTNPNHQPEPFLSAPVAAHRT